MNKISNAFKEIFSISELALRNNFLSNVNPLIKIILTIIYIVMLTSFNKYNLANILLMSLYPIIMFTLGDLSLFSALKSLKFILAFLSFMGLFNIFLDKSVVFQNNVIVITGGIISALSLIIKGCFCVLASYILISTTTIEKICFSLCKIHVPQILITQILITYRYIFLLLKEINYTCEAYSLKAPKQKGINIKLWGSLVGSILLRSIDRANEIYNGMVLRGFNGKIYFDENFDIKNKDIFFIIIWIYFFFMIKYLNI